MMSGIGAIRLAPNGAATLLGLLVDQETRQDVARKRAAVAELHETLYPRIVRYIAVRTGDYVEAEDLGSEVFVRALRAVERFEEKGIPLEAWIFRIAHNLVVDHLKGRGRRPRAASIEENQVDVADAGDELSAPLERGEDVVALRRAMAQLTDAQRQVLALRFSDAEMTSEQIARVLGKKPTAVREMQSAAIKRLRTILGTAAREQS